MDKVLLNSVDPTAGTGYGMQTGEWAHRWTQLGYEVAICAYAGGTASVREWEGITVYPPGSHPFGADVLPRYARHFGAKVVITLGDLWALGAAPLVDLAGIQVGCWMPVDCAPLGRKDKTVLNHARVTPIAMSRHGERMLRDEGFRPLYVPHGIDMAVFRPPADRAGLRKAMRVDDRFVVDIVATNEDDRRKGWFEQLSAFARLHRNHDDTVLLAHTKPRTDKGLDLIVMADQLGIGKAVRWCKQTELSAGLYTPEQMAGTAGASDLRSGCAWAEGFGLPLVEAQACGTPAVATDASAMREVCGGWLVPGEETWIAGHQASWVKPSIDAIARVYEKAYQRGAAYQAKKAAARPFAERYDAAAVLTEYWKPALEYLTAR